MSSWNNLSMKERADVIKLFVEKGIYNLDTIRGEYNRFADGGGIHIKDSKKGTFTAAASRHNMGVQEFASKVLANKGDYSSAMVKKANFARNASKWKHGLGGNLFEDGGPKKPFTKDDLRRMLQKNKAEAEAAYNGSITETQIIPNDNAWVDRPQTRRKKNPHTERRAVEGARADAAWRQEHPVATAIGAGLSAAPLAIAATPAVVGSGELGAAVLANPYVDAGLTSAFAGHGLNHWINEGIDGLGDAAMTALELTPLGRLAKPVYEGVAQPGMRLFNSPLTGNWTKIGNREYRLSPSSLSANGSPIESRGVVPQITPENATSITPEQWTAAQDAAIARGDMAEAQRLRDLHFKVSAPNTKVTDEVWHGSRRGQDFNTFDLRYFGYTDGGTGGYGHYFGPFKHASGYSTPKRFYLNVKKPYTGKYKHFFNRDNYFKDNELYGRVPSYEDAKLYKEGWEKYKNEFIGKDGVIDDDPLWGDLGPVYTVPKGEQIKLADAVTYNKGVRIPLGERDNFKLNDIRYGLLPFGIGLTGYGLLPGK